MQRKVASGSLERVASEQRRRLMQGASAALAAVAVAPFSLLTVRPGIAQTTKLLDAPDPNVPYSSPERRPVEDWMMRAGEETVEVEVKEKEITFPLGARKSVRALVATCRTDRGNQLTRGGRPLQARYLAWSISNIYWVAGVGWPVFVSVCPDPGLDPGFKFKHHRKFQVLAVFGGSQWLGCHQSAQALGDRPTDVWFWVNDFPARYGDNAGTFEVTITGLSL